MDGGGSFSRAIWTNCFLNLEMGRWVSFVVCSLCLFLFIAGAFAAGRHTLACVEVFSVASVAASGVALDDCTCGVDRLPSLSD